MSLELREVLQGQGVYLGYQFWSGEFTWADTTVTIENGIARIHVHRSGSPVVGARVYLFKGSGGYLGRYADTDDQGIAEFQLPDRQYKFRVDWEGAQYWTDPVTIVPHQVNEIDMDLDLLGLNLTGSRLYAHNTTKKIQLAMVGLPYGLLIHSVIAAPGVSEKIYYYHNDHLGTPQVLTDDNGQVVWKADYRPFGGVDIVVESVRNNFRFPGQYYDEETGLKYNYFRDYHPGIGRYLTPDPSHYPHAEKGIFPYLLPYLIVIPQEFSPYIFVLNNPINFVDSHGLTTLCKTECYTLKFLDVHHCNITWHIEYHECLKLFKINPKECIEQAKERHNKCLQRAEKKFKKCIEDCETEEKKKEECEALL